MASTENEIQVLLTADFSKLSEGMTGAQEAVSTGSAEMQSTLEASSAGMAEAQAAIAESADQAAARIREMVQASLSLAESTGVAAQSERSMRESMGLRTEATAEQLAASQALVEAQSRQMVGVEAYVSAEAAAAEATKAVTVATEEQTGATVVNSQVTREFAIMTGEALRGNYSRLAGSTTVLATRTGLMTQAIEFAKSPIGALSIGLGAVAFEAIRGYEASVNLNDAILATGDYAGVTASDLQGMAETMSGSLVTTSDAAEALAALARSGRFTGEALQVAGQAAAEFAALTGQSIDEAASKIEALERDPLRAVVSLNDQYHFLSSTEYQFMQQLVAEGRQYEATEVALKAFGNAMHERATQAENDLTYLGRAFEALKNEPAMLGHAMKGLLVKDSPAEQLSKQLDEMDRLMADHRVRFNSQAGHTGFEAVGNDPYAQAQVETYKRLAAAQAEAAKTAQDNAAAQKEQADEIHEAAKNNPALGGVHSARAELAAQRAAERAAAAARKRENAEEIAQLETKRAETTAGTRERLDADQQIVVRAAQLYTTDSANFQRALAQKARDEQDYNAKLLALRTQALEDARKEADSEIDTQREEYELQFQMGQISAQRLEQVEQQLVQRKLAIDLQYLHAKRELDAAAGDVAQAQKDDAAITAAKQRSTQQMLRIEQQYHRNSEREWRNYAQRIEGSMTTALNGIIFHGQTLRSALASVAETIAENFIRNEIKQLIEHQAVETSKTVATATGTAERVAIEQGAAATTRGITASTAIENILTKGAEVIANVWTSVAAIPYVGPFLAPAMAIAAGAEVKNLVSNVPSAAGGWGRVPADTLAQIHEDEMVLPPDLAHAVRRMAAQGGGGGGGSVVVHNHIHAIDAKNLRDHLRRNPGALAAGLSQMGRTGWRP